MRFIESFYKKLLKRLRRFFLKIGIFIFMRQSIRKAFSLYFRRIFLKRNEFLRPYKQEIVILAVFLFISSSFMCKRRNEEYFNFNWRSYFGIFSSKHMRAFILCSCRYLLDSGRVSMPRDVTWPELRDNFKDQYLYSLVHNRSHEFNNSIDFNKFMELLDIVWKINYFYQYEIPKDSSKVVNLVDYSWEFKEKILRMFENKAEYIIFSFFVNLTK